MSAGHTSVDKDFVTAGGIPSSHVETGFLEDASSGVHPVPGHDPLLLASDVARDHRLFVQQLLSELPAASAALASSFGMGLPLLLHWQLAELRGGAHCGVHWLR